MATPLAIESLRAVEPEPGCVGTVASGRLPTTREEPVTVVAVMDCGDSLLMASDSLVTDPGVRTTSEKLWILSDASLVMGFSGAEGVGLQFLSWLESRQWKTWQGFADEASERLVELNRALLVKASRVEQLPRVSGTSALVAGSVGGVLDAWELTEYGEAVPVRRRRFAGIGSGWRLAFVAYKALLHAGFEAGTLETMVGAMIVAAAHAEMCEGPVQLVRVTADGATWLRLRRGADGSWKETS
jgi:ATP-dependent protease HslVU (ClpYQ) peptidase subunit